MLSVDRLLHQFSAIMFLSPGVPQGPVIGPFLISRLYLGLYDRTVSSEHHSYFFWPPYAIGHAIIFLPRGFYLCCFFFLA